MKSALITGANRSIGLETAKQLSKKGVFVYLGARDLKNGEAAVQKLQEQGFENIRPIVLDVTNRDTIAAAKKTIENEHGKLDILINNAGISGDVDSHFQQNASDTPDSELRRVFDINFFGTINVTQEFLALLQQSDSPRISMITSGLASLTSHNDPKWMYYAVKMAAYGPSKTALNAYTIALAYELRDSKFKINAIDPGYTATDFNHHSGPGTVENAASFIVKHTLTDENAPTGKFYSNDIEDESEESPW